MKIIFSLSVLLLFTITCFSQGEPNVPDPPGFEVIRVRSYQAIANERTDQKFDKAILDQNEARADLINPERIRTESPRPLVNYNGGDKSRRTYIYELKIKNSGPKAIEKVVLEYRFIDSVTNKELGRRFFISDTVIQAGKNQTLTFRSPLPLIKNKDKKKRLKPLGNKTLEKAVIQRIEYKDGSVWKQQPSLKEIS